MSEESRDAVEFDDIIARALADLATGPVPRADVRARLLDRVSPQAPGGGFQFRFASDANWVSHPVAGIRMRVLATNQATGYATVLVDVEPGVRFPPHHHGGDEDCYVISGSVHTLGRRLGPGDFLHADAGTDHEELWTPDGARVLLIVPAAEVPT
jgi:quercetin dioxygenase-like cupin family protein